MKTHSRFIVLLLALALPCGIAYAAPAVPVVQIEAPGSGESFSDGSILVDVAFSISKGNVHTVKLQVDGADYDSEAVHQKNGTITFSVDVMSLGEGSHTLQAFAYLGAQQAGHDGASPAVSISIEYEDEVITDPDPVETDDDETDIEDDDDTDDQDIVEPEDDTDVTPGEEETPDEVDDGDTGQEEVPDEVDDGGTDQVETPDEVTEEPDETTDDTTPEIPDTVEVPDTVIDDGGDTIVEEYPPALKIVSPEDGVLTGTGNITVSGSTDPDASVSINGETAAVKPDGSFAVSVNLDEGVNVLSIEALGVNGMFTAETLNATLDRTPPEMTLIGENNQIVSFPPEIMVQAIDDNGLNENTLKGFLSGGNLSEMSIDGSMISVRPSSGLRDGSYNISVSISDSVGNEGTINELSFMLDTLFPEVSRLSINDGQLIPLEEVSGGLEITGRIQDPLGGSGINKDETYFFIDGAEQNSHLNELTGDFSVRAECDSPGIRVLTIESADFAGNIMPPVIVTFSIEEEIEVISETEDVEEDTTPQTQPAAKIETEKIIFTRQENRDVEIYSYDTATGETSQITDTTGNNLRPSYSPAIRKITFASTRDGNSEIYMMNQDGTEQTRLTNNPAYDSDPAISPNGRTIAFVSDRDGDYSIYTIDISMNEITKVTEGKGIREQPTFSPDGSKIAYTSNAAGDFDIYTIDLRTGRENNISQDPENLDSHPIFSRDGKYIYYISNRESGSDVYRSELSSGRVSRITSDGLPKSGIIQEGSELLVTIRTTDGYTIANINPDSGTIIAGANNISGMFPTVAK